MEREDRLFNKGLAFDDLMKLSPAELEALRQREVDALIEQAPEAMQRRLRGLQFEVDAKRKAHKSPLGSCIAISKMMQESLDRLNAALQGRPLPKRELEGQVIPFERFRQSHRDQPRG